MTIERCCAFAVVFALSGMIAGQAAELPTGNTESRETNHGWNRSEHCDITGSPAYSKTACASR